MHCDTRNDGRLQWPMFQLLFRCCWSQHRQILHGVQYIPPIQQPTKYSMQLIQMGLLIVTEKELRSIRIRSFIGHGQDSPFIMGVVGMEFVGKGSRPPNRFASLGPRLFGRVTSLDHEATNIPVKGGAIVGT